MTDAKSLFADTAAEVKDDGTVAVGPGKVFFDDATLTASGRRTGLHTKPHLFSVTERARIDGVAISEDRFAELLTEMGVKKTFRRVGARRALLSVRWIGQRPAWDRSRLGLRTSRPRSA